jgi:hypothetical protein
MHREILLQRLDSIRRELGDTALILNALRVDRSIAETNHQQTVLDISIRNAEARMDQLAEEQRGIEAKLRGISDAPSAKPLIGASSHLTCDRGAQERAFDDHLRYFALLRRQNRYCVPQVYILYGSRQQKHSSLVKRLCETKIRLYAAKLQGKVEHTPAPPVLHLEIPGPDEGNVELRLKRLKASIFEWFDNAYGFESEDYSQAALRRLLKSKRIPLIVIQHNISAAALTGECREVIQSYLKFLDGFYSEDVEVPQMIVFFNVFSTPREQSRPETKRGLIRLFRRVRAGGSGTQPSDEDTELTMLRVTFELTKRQPESAFKSKSAPCIMLNKLTCVTQQDVMNWFDRNLSAVDIDVKRECAWIIGEAECKDMDEIESALGKVVQKVRQGRSSERL